MQKISKLLLATFLASGASSAFACGESLFHSGVGMRYHGFITRQPADILLFRSDAAALESDRQIGKGLQRAGHRVTVVTDKRAAIAAITTRHYDVIIASAHDMDELSTQISSSAPTPRLLAIVDQGDKADRARYPQCVQPSDDVNQYLKTIEQSLHPRGS